MCHQCVMKIKMVLRNQTELNRFTKEDLDKIRKQIKLNFPHLSNEECAFLLLVGKETNQAYKRGNKEIQILLKDGKTRPISEWREHNIVQTEVIKHFACYPKM